MIIELPSLNLYCYHDQVTEIVSGRLTLSDGATQELTTALDIYNLDVILSSPNSDQSSIEIYSEDVNLMNSTIELSLISKSV